VGAGVSRSAWGVSWGYSWGNSWGNVAPQSTGTIGGSGYPVWRKKEPRSPSNSIDMLWDLVLSEYYESLVDSPAPDKVKKQAAAIVKPFAKHPVKLPKADQIDWAALEMDVARVEKLLRIMEEQGILRAIDDDDETILMMVH